MTTERTTRTNVAHKACIGGHSGITFAGFLLICTTETPVVLTTPPLSLIPPPPISQPLVAPTPSTTTAPGTMQPADRFVPTVQPVAAPVSLAPAVLPIAGPTLQPALNPIAQVRFTGVFVSDCWCRMCVRVSCLCSCFMSVKLVFCSSISPSVGVRGVCPSVHVHLYVDISGCAPLLVFVACLCVWLPACVCVADVPLGCVYVCLCICHCVVLFFVFVLPGLVWRKLALSRSVVWVRLCVGVCCLHSLAVSVQYFLAEY